MFVCGVQFICKRMLRLTVAWKLYEQKSDFNLKWLFYSLRPRRARQGVAQEGLFQKFYVNQLILSVLSAYTCSFSGPTNPVCLVQYLMRDRENGDGWDDYIFSIEIFAFVSIQAYMLYQLKVLKQRSLHRCIERVVVKSKSLVTGRSLILLHVHVIKQNAVLHIILGSSYNPWCWINQSQPYYPIFYGICPYHFKFLFTKMKKA